MKLTIELPHPNNKTLPNQRNGQHWRTIAKASKGDHDLGFYLTKQAYPRVKLDPKKEVHVTITVKQGKKRRSDSDGLLGSYSIKKYLDGIAQALSVDDRIFNPVTIVRLKGQPIESTVVEITSQPLFVDAA